MSVRCPDCGHALGAHLSPGGVRQPCELCPLGEPCDGQALFAEPERDEESS